MRLLVVSPCYPSYSGKYVCGFVHARVKAYIKQGLNVKVYVPTNIYERYDYESVNVYKAPYSHLEKILEDFDPDVICIHFLYPKIRKIMKISSSPIVVWVHGTDVLIKSLNNYFPSLTLRDNVNRMYSLFWDIVRNLRVRLFFRKIDAVIYVSNWMKNAAERYLLCKHPNSYVIPNPVDTDLFKPINMNKDTYSAISLRSLGWKYGLDIAIKAYSNFKKSSLTIIGQGPLEAYLKNLAKKLNSNVKFITKGYEHGKLPEVFNSYGFFIAPSRTEAQGVSMCEAMASGLPVVATRVGGIPEFVIDGYNGLLVPPEDPLSLRRAVMKLISDDSLYDELSKNARKFAVENLSHKVIIKKELEVFKEILS